LPSARHIAFACGQNDGALRWRELTPELYCVGAAWAWHLWVSLWTTVDNHFRPFDPQKKLIESIA
jgi:hypothetical protein